MKRQETLRTSSSRRKPASTDQPTVRHAAYDCIGCMAGVFQLISSKYRTRRKFLTFGRKRQEKQTTLSTSTPEQLVLKSPARESKGEDRHHFDGSDAKSGFKEDKRKFLRLSCEIPRSPTISPEIRRSNSLNSPESFRSPVPSVVARLMGLEDVPVSAAGVMPLKPESAADKRRKLLGALEKCDEDLQMLKRIIETVRSADRSKIPAPPLVGVGRGGGMAAIKKCTDQISGMVEQEQPSPVSVLEDFTESPLPYSTSKCCSSKRTRNDMCHGWRVIPPPPPQQQQRKKPGEDNIEIASFCFHNDNRLHVLRSLLHLKTATTSPPRSSGATMTEAVNEVCRDVDMGQRREIERLGVMVEDFIYRDMIEEMTKELLGCSQVKPSLPFARCKRNLRF